MLPFVLMEVFLPGTHFPEKRKVIVSGLYHTTLFLMSNFAVSLVKPTHEYIFCPEKVLYYS